MEYLSLGVGQGGLELLCGKDLAERFKIMKDLDLKEQNCSNWDTSQAAVVAELSGSVEPA